MISETSNSSLFSQFNLKLFDSTSKSQRPLESGESNGIVISLALFNVPVKVPSIIYFPVFEQLLDAILVTVKEGNLSNSSNAVFFE